MTKKEAEKEKENTIADIFKKVVSTSVNAAFMTEDTVKGILNDLPLPKDLVNGLLQNAKSSKEEFVSSIKNEFKSYLDKIDVSKEIDRVLDNYDIDVKVKFNRKTKKDVTKK